MTLPYANGQWINCLSLSVVQNITPLSTATMEVLKDDVPAIRSFVEITTPNGKKEYYRVRQPQLAHDTGIATVQLDHAICEVGDYLVQGEIKNEMTVAQALNAVFEHYTRQRQNPYWQLGTFTATETVTVDCSNDNVLETMLAVLEQVPKYMMTFNFNTTPWTVSIAEKPDSVTAEGRISRNIENVSVKYDDKDLCTRVYVNGLPSPGYMDADTISTYGVIECETGSNTLTQAQAQRVATAYLNAHKRPKLSIEINGEDLSDVTGETLDSFVVGKKFRLALPDDNVVIEDYITKVSYNDVIGSGRASIVIGNDLDATLNFLEDQASKSKSYGRSIRNQENENRIIHTEIYATGSMLYSFVEQTATYILDVVENVESSLGSAILQTACQIRSEVHASESTIYSYVDQTATYIESVVANTASDLGSAILQTASEIRSEVHASESETYSYIDQTASYIETVVASTASDLGSAILQTANQIRSEVHASESTTYSYIDQTASYIEGSVASTASSLNSSILQTANQIRSEVNASDSALYSYVNQTASGIRQEVANTANGLQTDIDQQADKISLVVQGTGSNAYIKAASIAAAINAQTGQSTVRIAADMIELDGFAVASALQGKHIEAQFLGCDDLQVTSSIYVDDDTDIRYGGSVNSMMRMIVSAAVDSTTNTLTLMQLDGTPINFSKAASGGNKVSGSWSGKVLTVGLSATGLDSYASSISTGFVTDSYVTPNTYHITAYRQDNGDQQPTEIQAARMEYKLGVLDATPNVVRILNASGSTYINGTATYTIPAPTVNTWALTDFSAPYSYKATVKVNGTTYTSGTLNASEAFVNGWNGCYGNVGLDSTAAITLAYGESLTVYAQAYQSSSAQVKTNVASRVITAPADRYSDGQKSITPSLSCDTTNDKFVAMNPYDTTKKRELLVNQAFESASGGLYYITTGYKSPSDQGYAPVIKHTVSFNTGSVSDGSRLIKLKYDGTDQALTYTCPDYGNGYSAGQSDGYSSGRASVTPNLVYDSTLSGFVASNPYDSGKKNTLNVEPGFIRDNNIYYIRVGYKAPSDQGYGSAKREVVKLGLRSNSNYIDIKQSDGTAYSGSPTAQVSTRFTSKTPSGGSENVTCVEARVYSYSDGDATKSAKGGEVFDTLGYSSSTYTRNTSVQVQYAGGSGTEGTRIGDTYTLDLSGYWDTALSSGRSSVTPNLVYDSSVTGFVAKNPYNTSNTATLNVDADFIRENNLYYIRVAYKAPSDQGYGSAKRNVVKLGLKSSSNIVEIKDSNGNAYSGSPTVTVSSRFTSKTMTSGGSNVTCIESRVYSYSDGDGTKSAKGGEVFYKLGYNQTAPYSRGTWVQIEDYSSGSRISDTAYLSLNEYYDCAYNAQHNFVLMGPNDAQGRATFVTSQAVRYGSPVDVWPAFRKYGVSAGDTNPNNYIYGSKITFTNSHTNTIAVKQATGYNGDKKIKLYYEDNNGNYHNAGLSDKTYWYFSSSDLSTTSSYKTLYYP